MNQSFFDVNTLHRIGMVAYNKSGPMFEWYLYSCGCGQIVPIVQIVLQFLQAGLRFLRRCGAEVKPLRWLAG